MKLRYYYWQFEGALSKKLCNKFLKKGLSKKKSQGITAGFAENPHSIQAHQRLNQKRDSNVRWMSDPEYYELLHPFIATANRNAGWNFEWDWSESSQVSSYTKGQFYGWHQDSFYPTLEDKNINPTQDVNTRGKIRKITSILQLTDPSKYEGGDISLVPLATEMETLDERPEGLLKPNFFAVPKTQGTIFCFPSFVWHKAHPVTKGVRYSINTWHWGWPFK